MFCARIVINITKGVNFIDPKNKKYVLYNQVNLTLSLLLAKAYQKGWHYVHEEKL